MSEIIFKKTVIQRILSTFVFSVFLFFSAFAEGSKNVTPDSTGVATGANTFIGFLQHNDGNNSGGFLKSTASDEEKLYIRILDGETLYYGLRRALDTGGDQTDLIVTLYDNSNSIVMQTTLLRDESSTNDVLLLPATGVIGSYARAAAGPSAIVGASGYNALSYTNNTGSDQDFWVSFDETGAQTRSAYDLWDFSVYDGADEKTGRLYSQSWSFNGLAFANQMSTEFQMYALVDNVGPDGFYVKEFNLAGIQPFGMIVYANSTGADDDLLNPGTADDFQELRRSQPGTPSVANAEYKIFVNNPDIVEYPTASLPVVSISDFNKICNADGTASAVVNIKSNLDGIISLIIDINGVPGYQNNTTDVIIEAESTANVEQSLIWNGLDGTGAIVASGTNLSITGRYAAGPVHIPLFDVEINDTGVNPGVEIVDVRPATTFDQIYWDDTNMDVGLTTFEPRTELQGTNSDGHDWGNNATDDREGDNALINTWSYGFLQLNSQTVTFNYNCDQDGDGVSNVIDIDSDNDGIPDSVEGDVKTDTDGDDIPNYLDADVVGFVDVNGDGVNDTFDTDLDGIPNAFDLDSDNDGITDVIENGGTDTNNDGLVDTSIDQFMEAEDATVGSNWSTSAEASASGGQYVSSTLVSTGTAPANNAANRVRYTFDIGVPGNYSLNTLAQDFGGNSFWVSINEGTAIRYNLTGLSGAEFEFNDLHDSDVDEGIEVLLNLSAGSNTIDFLYREASTGLDAVYLSLNDAITPRDTDQDGVVDFLDIDSDNDGIVDVVEAGGSADTESGNIASYIDINENGWNDNTEIFPLALTDTDGGVDGLEDYRDIDSDDDGIVDNREAQSSQSYISPATFVDSDGDGLDDTYDPNNGGTLLNPVNTDGAGGPDYQDTDSDEDGVFDVIEGFDNDQNGFGDWDLLGSNNAITDEIGYNIDTDGDGLWDVFETEVGGAAAGIGNVTGSTAVHQNSDNADNADWQDTDDDNDGILTSGEDDNGNGDFADDKTQGQTGASSPPDYLFKGDCDGDGVADVNDLDSDNDGVLDTDEDGGTGIDPSADDDSDGIVNYRDSSIAGFTDANSDGVDDRMDKDQDGIPNFLDIDSDNDGLYDAYEANNGVAPVNFNSITGQFNLDDPDNDGLMNQVDSNTILSGGNSTLPTADLDADGIDDFLDLDSDNDGIPDNIEFQAEGGFIAASGNDTDGDGVDDAYDPNNGGTQLTAVNTDGTDEPDYRDTDSDDDTILDRVEGNDLNNDGFGDWDDDLDGTINEADYGVDTDNDGIVDAFDNVASVDEITNVTGSNAALQNTDGLDNRDWRDTNDDNDGDLTIDEDDNGNGDFTDDRTDGQGGSSSIPDYLFNGDNDSDGIGDIADSDSDNDGIPDVDEAGTSGINPSQDADGDGILNFRDTDIAGFTDSNGDGVDDRSDKDLDGVPDFHDLDSDNDGIPDAVEANNGTLPNDMTANGQFPAAYVINPANDPDGDGFPLNFDSDDGGTPLSNLDHDGDGINDYLDLDSDNDGIADIVEAGGVDSDGDGRVDNFVDGNNDGLASIVDLNESGIALTYPNSDTDSFTDYFDADSDNDGISDAIEQGGRDTDANGQIDGFVDTDSDGFSDNVDTDNGGTALLFNDQDGDGLQNYRDLDSDNDGLPDLIEGGGIDADVNGIVDGTFTDANNNGLDDSIELAPLPVVDTDNDGFSDFIDIDSDNDGIPDVIEIGQTSDSGGRIDGFIDANSNGLNDTQEGAAITPTSTDTDGIADYLDIDSDNDGIVDNVEAQTKATYVTLSGNDTDNDGLDDSYDPDNGGSLISPTDTDGTGNPDYTDTDSDDDAILDIVEGHDGNRDGFGDWDINTDGNDTDETGFDTDLDEDGLLDFFDTFGGLGENNITGSSSALQDTDNDNSFDFQDIDDDGDGINTGDGTGGTEGNAYTDDPDGNIPNYLFDTKDDDGDGVLNTADLDSDNDGILDTDEDGGVGIDPSADADGDGLLNFEDTDFTGYVDVNNNGVDDRYDHDGDGVPDFLDLDSDNDGIQDAIEANSGIVPATDYTLNNGRFDDVDADNDGLADVVDSTPGVSGGTSTLANPDSDVDSINDVLDIDSDNDGLTDNRESQVSASYITLTSGDTDNDGLLDVYDGNNGGTSLTPTDSDASLPDYIDTDSDGDGLNDIIEGHDSDSNGFADWDTDGDNVITDETGNNADVDGDGLWNIFDTDNASTGISNVDASNADFQDSDSDGLPDFQDADDDGDLIATLTEDSNPSDGNYTNDFTQGGGSVPDYLFVPDQDGDNVLDNVDGDSDNDGIPNSTEYATATYAVGSDVSSNAGNPFGDSDGDGLYNYLDDSDVNFTLIDVNADGIDDRVDQDFDGVPNFFDLDSDNDGIQDAIEANNGLVPADFDTSTGRFTSGDADGDGINSTVDNVGSGESGTSLTNEDFDSDLLDDYLDLDSDNDGISDNQEGQSETRIEPSGIDANGDGLDDSYDGADAITPINTDAAVVTFGDTEPDYRDLDADADGVSDRIEGHDTNINGFADWDSGNDDNDFTAETGFNTDGDGDGIVDLFDTFTGFGISNIDGTIASLQDTDSNGTRDWRDEDDDGDSVDTRSEDFNTNDIWYDDKNQGGGAGPDYLFFADKDLDGVADNISFDGDNDGIPNNIEIGALQNPYNDGDGDGIPAFLDSSEAGYTDTNSDGVDDRYDFDLDGEPDFLDLDSDNDGISDAVEANGGVRPADMNSEGQYPAAYTQANDANNNGLVDDVETGQGGTALANPDSDGDGLSDYIDLDSDNDGIPDIIEAGGADVDNNGKIDAFGDSDGDGLSNIVDVDNGGSAYNIEDLDGDGLPNYIDADTDNDGLSDIYEAGGVDLTNDGRADVLTDTDTDGWVDLFDNDNSGTALSIPDKDGDGNENYRDLDSDNDGIPDAIERNGGTLPANMTTDGEYASAYVVIAANDLDTDGLFNDTDNTSPTITSTDGDGLPDHLDLDSDSDGIPDILEVNGVDNDNDGKIDNFVDTDGDGFADALDSDNSGTALTIVNTDGDATLPDYRDIDADNDGIPDIIEVNGSDADNNGIADVLTDTDNDGWSDTFDANNGGTALIVVDIDGDGLFGFQDLDADNDGLSDIIETNGTDADNDGLPASIMDTDVDGWPDAFDSDNTGTAYTYPDTDGDGRNDFADLDSDNDGIPDAVEANAGILPTNMNVDGQFSPFNDTDGDGYSNDRDASNGGTLYTDPNTDGDSVIDRLDLDSDNDGIPDAVEANGGTLPANMDANGTFSSFTDSDFDGLHDNLDSDDGGTALANPNSDNGLSGGDIIPDYLDLDADSDGIVDVVEAGGVDTNQDGRIDSFADADGDGLDNTLDPDFGGGVALPYTNTDGDANPDYIDTDSDNDSVSDLIEAFDSNTNATAAGGTADGVSPVTPVGTDSDGDGIDDNFEGAIPSFQDTDGTGEDDWRDTDDDDDGIPTGDENADVNPVNGIPDYLEATTNPCGGNSVQLYPEDADITAIAGVTEVETDNAIGAPDGLADGTNTVPMNTNGDEMQVDLQHFLSAGTGSYTIVWKRTAGNGDEAFLIVQEAVNAAGPYTQRSVIPSTTNDVGFTTSVFTPEVDTRYLRIIKDGGISGNATDFDVDAVGVCSPDSDNDLVADRNDLDDDNDGIQDLIEIASAVGDPSADDDVDGLLNYEDTDIAGFVDSNLDDVNDNFDQDLDGVPNHLDLDSDNDGMTDALEANESTLPSNMTPNGRYASSYVVVNDTDNDGLANDVDTDNGGTVLVNPNTDGDGNVDFLDLDSDNDGIPDVIEAGGSDSDNNGVLDSTTDADGNGLFDLVDSNEGGTALTIPNSDGDNLPDYRDVDSDNDGIADVIEGGGVDSDGDGLVDSSIDTDGDGWADTFDSDNGGTALVADSDGDGLANYLDLDADNDGLPDALEANGGTLPSNMDIDGQYPSTYVNSNDTDGDGLADDVDTDDAGTALAVPNTDGIGGADYIDIDSDNDGIPDIIEVGGTDTDNDGKVDDLTDTDNDGIVDAFDPDNGGSALIVSNADGDGLPTYRDLDSDNDGIPDIVEMGGTDADGNGLADNPSDNDGDGWSNTFDSDNSGTPFTTFDTDGDGLNNNEDLDSDSDGIADAYEANDGNLPAGMDADGKYTTLVDTDGDGLHDNVDTDDSGTALPVGNTDGTGNADFVSIDSDGDGVADYIEAFDDDESGNSGNDFIARALAWETANANPGQYPASDLDSDGVPDWLEDDDSDGLPNYLDPDNATYYLDTDNDGIVDLHDPDQNGVAYGAVSGQPDEDNDGIPNQYDTDDTVALPVDLVFFDAEFKVEMVVLTWQTSVEINNDFFEVYKSIDGVEFEMIGIIEGNGNSNELIDYQFVDEEPIDGINYYKLKQVDFNGEYEFSATINVIADLTDFSLKVYPNPVSEKLNIQFNSSSTDLRVRLIDPRGSILEDISENVRGKKPLKIDIKAIQNGIYYLHIYVNGRTIVRKVIIQH